MSDIHDRIGHGVITMYYYWFVMARVIHSTAPRLAAAVRYFPLYNIYIHIDKISYTFDKKSGIFAYFYHKSITIPSQIITVIFGHFAGISLFLSNLDITNAPKNITESLGNILS